jgi:hypothetical protein
VRTTATATADYQKIKSNNACRYCPVTRTGLLKFFYGLISDFIAVGVATIVECKWNVV